jgi:two-component system sensor histidine kinase PilS (NtrC family)
MDEDDGVQHSWFEPPGLAAPQDSAEESQEFVRLWQAFMTARLTLGVVMVALQSTLYLTGFAHSLLLVAISVGYCITTATSRLLDKPRALGLAFNRSWVTSVGVDVLAFSGLQMIQGSNINYTPLFALPILLSAVLGPMRLALGTAAGVTLLLLVSTLWTSLTSTTDATPYLVQAALSGLGYFAIALLASQLSGRLASAGQRARVNQAAANIQRHVNELVIESLPDGVLIVDANARVLAANPAARQMLGAQRPDPAALLSLTAQPGWSPLWSLARTCIATGTSLEEDATLHHEGHGAQRMRVRTRLAALRACASSSCKTCARWKHACAPKSWPAWAACLQRWPMKSATRWPPLCKPMLCWKKT